MTAEITILVTCRGRYGDGAVCALSAVCIEPTSGTPQVFAVIIVVDMVDT